MSTENCEYAAVVRKTTILAQYANRSGNFDVLMNEILQKLNSQDQRFTTEKGGHKFYVQRYSDADSDIYFKDQDGEPTPDLYFVLVGSLNLASNDAYSILDRIQKSFLLRHSRAWQKAPPYGLNNEFSGEIRRCLDDRISKIKQNLSDTQNSMTEALQEALIKHETLNEMNEKANLISTGSQDFSRSANQIRRRMCCEKYRYAIIIAIIAVVMILIIVIAVTCSDDKKKK